jgi:hypothetical protein
MPAWRRFRITMTVIAAYCLLPLAYSVFHVATHRPARSAPALAPTSRASHPAATSGASHPAATGLALQITPAPYQLPAPLSREVALSGPGGLLIAGGLTAQGT